MDENDLHVLMAEVGQQDDDILAVVVAVDGAYAIRFEDLDVMAEWDDTRRRLVLSSEIGAPPSARAAPIHAVLLAYSMTWRSTGGIFMALTGPGGEAVQCVDLADADLNARRIAVVAVNLATRTRIWRAFFAQDATPSDDQSPVDLEFLSLIRV